MTTLLLSLRVSGLAATTVPGQAPGDDDDDHGSALKYVDAQQSTLLRDSDRGPQSSTVPGQAASDDDDDDHGSVSELRATTKAQLSTNDC